MRCTNALLLLAYGPPAHSIDYYVCIGETTTLQCLDKFSRDVYDIFRAEYLRRPNNKDIQYLLQIGEQCSFPGMLGSIDCMRWE